LENRVKTLEEELNNSKFDFENLEMIYQNSSFNCVESSFCENFVSLQMKVNYFLKTVDRFSKGQSVLKLLLPHKIVVLESLDWNLTQTARTYQFQNPFQVSLKTTYCFVETTGSNFLLLHEKGSLC